MDSIERYLEKNLSEKRRQHVKGVVKTARKLAERYGADGDKACTAALFHDMFRSQPVEMLNMYVRQLGLAEEFLDNANLAHGPIAAVIMARDYGVGDEDTVNAVRWHTTGRAGMSTLEKVIYLADAIEPARRYPGVEKLRELADISLDRACLFSLERTIAYVKEQGHFLHPATVAARDDLRQRLQEQE